MSFGNFVIAVHRNELVKSSFKRRERDAFDRTGGRAVRLIGAAAPTADAASEVRKYRRFITWFPCPFTSILGVVFRTSNGVQFAAPSE